MALFLYISIEYYTKNELDAIAQRATQTQKRLISLEQESFKTTSDTVAAIIFDNRTKTLMYRLKKGEISPDKVREVLLRHYLPIYRELKKQNLRHLQFHMPDGTSLLRVHKPDKYGDSLLDIRSSIAKIVEVHKPLYGFEIGKYLGAYRAIYPLFYKKQYVGSAELSFTFLVMKKALERLSEGAAHYYLALNLDRVKESADWKQLHLYRRCYVDPAFIINENVVDSCKILRETGYRTNLLPYREFSAILVKPEQEYHIVSFIPLKAIDGTYVGYYIVIQNDTGAVASILSLSHIGKIAIALLAIVSLFLILMIHFYRVKAHAANIDPLTGVYNRRGCLSALNAHTRYALIFIDIDNFKPINDNHGHDKGDEVLKTISRIIATHIRKEDVFCRYGGDEFLIFLANAGTDQAYIVAEKLRKHIDIHRFEGVENVTVSIGIAIRHRNESIGSLINRADQGLYKAKESGRNVVIVEEEQKK
ncbi:diguanylate cyclase [Hydrogenimonas sp. SS33]|uniref:diguanylate cyclase n=1 Tax=Hydrogenimonas leucolamina TaxID=2954236 RepID=UPI00336BC487